MYRNEAVEDLVKALKPIDALDELRLYRGMTGSEDGGKAIFFTDNPAVAKSYSATGEVIEIVISKVQAQKMLWSNQLQTMTGMHTSTGIINTEYKFLTPNVRKAVISLSN